MKKKICLMLSVGMIALICVNTTSCKSDGVETPSQASILQKADGIIKLSSGIGEWDAAYLTKHGYFCYKEDASTAANDYTTVTYMPADANDIVSLIAKKADKIPTQMVTKNGIVYFSFPNDTILELVYDNGTSVTMLDSVPYSKEKLATLIASNNDDVFKATLSAAASLLKKDVTRSTAGETIIETYGEVFEEVSGESYVDNNEVTGEITSTESGTYEFAEVISDWYDDEVVEFVCNTLTLWTGKATYKVGGSSCTLSGTIWCPSNIYNTYGTYGIICDEDQAKLFVGNAEYEGTGFQSEEDMSYSVDFRGFKPNTTYYYRSYYKFNSSDHGSILPKYGNPEDQVFYDTTIKSFKTGDNSLTVDVAMCIDVTGSMSDIIGTVKRNAIAFYDLFNNACEEEGIMLTGLNSQVIAFQDINHDGDRWMNVSPTYSLPEEKDDFNTFVNALYADDGGDTPESGLEALDRAFSKDDWGVDDGYHRQVIILWTDAPYLIDTYSSITIGGLEEKWNAMPSGRRLILFAPNGSGYSNGGDWAIFDDWKNTIHETNLSSGFNDFGYILKSIIGELTSKSKTTKHKAPAQGNVYFRPNK